MNRDVISFLNHAIECSVFVCPARPGLTYEELCEAGRRAGYQKGEIEAAWPFCSIELGEAGLLMPGEHMRTSWLTAFPEDPDYRDLGAFDFVISELNDRLKSEGLSGAQIDRTILIERAKAQGLERHAVEVAIAYQALSGAIEERAGTVRFPPLMGPYVRDLPSLRFKRSPTNPVHLKPFRAKAFPIVQDIDARRTDGRRPRIEALDAFAGEIDRLGFKHLRLWWSQMAREMETAEPTASAASITVLAAALVEAALAVVVRHAQSLQSGLFPSRTFSDPPKHWKLDDLVKGAASGNAPILSPTLKISTDMLCLTRQRIHAGRYLDAQPGALPDIRPEDASQAKDTAKQVVRAVLEWLELNPPGN